VDVTNQQWRYKGGRRPQHAIHKRGLAIVRDRPI
jgi:hypothetical protein